MGARGGALNWGIGRPGPDLPGSTLWSPERRCDPFLMTALSFAEVETCVLSSLGPLVNSTQFIVQFGQGRDVFGS